VNSSDNLLSYSPDNHHSSDDVCWSVGGEWADPDRTVKDAYENSVSFIRTK